MGATLMGCVDYADDGEDGGALGASPIEDVEVRTTSNPAAFDLNCLYRGSRFYQAAPHQLVIDTIGYACDIQTGGVEYHAPGSVPYQLELPNAQTGIDCSGLTANVWYRATSGFVQLPHSAADQEKQLKWIPDADILPGDFIFYYSAKAASGRHVAMYLGEGKMIEARGSNEGVVVDYVRPGWTSIRRVGWW
jgi:cell wall-associated NlpC family hydrolase